MAPPKRKTGGRTTPKGTRPGDGRPASPEQNESGVAASSRYTPPIPQYVKESPRWVPVLMFVLLPTAPPWMAASKRHPYRILPPLERTTGRGWSELGLETVTSLLIRGQQWANPTAAFPSLHAAFALLVVVFFWPRFTRRWQRIAAGSFPLLMAFSLVYFAEHYVADILAGWILVAGSFWVWGRYERSRALPRSVSAQN